MSSTGAGAGSTGTTGFVLTTSSLLSRSFEASLGCARVSRRLTYALLAAVVAVPRLVALGVERGDILTSFTDKSDDFARTFLASGTYGFVAGHPSAYTQPLYGFFLAPVYWIFGRNWVALGLAQIALACVTAVLVYELGRRLRLSPPFAVLAALATTLSPYLVWHDVHVNREIVDQPLAAGVVLATLVAAERRSWRYAVLAGGRRGDRRERARRDAVGGAEQGASGMFRAHHGRAGAVEGEQFADVLVADAWKVDRRREAHRALRVQPRGGGGPLPAEGHQVPVARVRPDALLHAARSELGREPSGRQGEARAADSSHGVGSASDQDRGPGRQGNADRHRAR